MMQVSVPTGALDRLRSSLTGMQNMNASIFETDAPDSITVAPTIGCKFFLITQAVTFDEIVYVPFSDIHSFYRFWLF